MNSSTEISTSDFNKNLWKCYVRMKKKGILSNKQRRIRRRSRKISLWS